MHSINSKTEKIPRENKKNFIEFKNITVDDNRGDHEDNRNGSLDPNFSFLRPITSLIDIRCLVYLGFNEFLEVFRTDF